MDRQKTQINGYFEEEKEAITTTLSRKLVEMMDSIEVNKIEKRVLPELMREYLGEKRANVYECSELVLKIVKAFVEGKDEFENFSENLADYCADQVQALEIIEEIEEILDIIKEAELKQDGPGIDIIKIEFELGERLKEKGKVILTKEERVNLLEPLLMEATGKIKNAREEVKARVDLALEQIKKQGKNKFFYVPTERLELEKDKLKTIKRFAKERLAKKAVLEIDISDDDQISNP